MALLRIDEDWRIIDSDQYNWILQKRSIVQKTDNIENIGKERWSNEGYYSTLPGAVRALVDRSIKIPDDVNGVLDKLDVLTDLVNERFASIETALQPVEVVKPVVPVQEDDMEDFLS
jgi:hypothetical protein